MSNRQKVAWMVLCLCAGASVRMFINERPAVEGFYFGVLSFAQWSLVASPLIFLFSAIRVFFNETIAFIAGLVAALLAMPNPLLLERYMRSAGLSWWTSFNMGPSDFGGIPPFAPWLILSVVTCTLLFVVAVTRLLPERWQWNGLPIRQRNWPAVTVTTLILLTWYARSTSPYRVPVIVDGGRPDLSILHVTKRGFQFSEENLKMYRDGRVYRTAYNRHFFQYAFPIETTMAVMPRELFAKSRAFASSDHPAIGTIKKLRGWNGEGWYVLGRSELAFTTDNGSSPPAELVALFQQARALQATDRGKGEIRDICLGFCYDPRAGLGLIYVNQRCRWSQGDSSHSSQVYDCL